MTATPQSALFAEGNAFYLALEYRCTASPALKAALRQAHAAASAAKDTEVLIAFGNNLLRAFSGGQINGFTPINGASGLTAPSTQRDLLIWIHSKGPDKNFDLARAVHGALKDHAQLALEIPGFNYHENRDMTGFIDGTANPQAGEAREAALIPPGQPNEGGAYVMSMQYVHDLDAFNKLSVPEQEKTIGRSKHDSTELQGADKPHDAHIARAELSENGEELKIYRRSFPYGGVAQHGLYFLAFARDQHRFDAILKSMYGVGGDGVPDRLLSFTRAITGSYWFAPSNEALQKMLA